MSMWKVPVVAAALAVLPLQAIAQDSAFSPGWILNPESSTLRFQTIKKLTKVESSTFATYTGTIDETGLATIRVGLDSIDTKIDLRNVRMRFLFFETFLHPEAVITLQITPEITDDLSEVRRKVVMMPYTISLHGVTMEREAEIAITLLGDDLVSVTSSTPISLPVADFNLAGGITKLEEAADVTIVPSATVTFDFIFNRSDSAESYEVAAAEMAVLAGLGGEVMEEEGDFSLKACSDRFNVMSQTDNITFTSGSSRLTDASGPLLDSIVEIIGRCPELMIQIAGHTDSDGSQRLNQVLSESRAQSVVNYLTQGGVDQGRVAAVGFGEDDPLVPNTSPDNKRRNRRIEFTILNNI